MELEAGQTGGGSLLSWTLDILILIFFDVYSILSRDGRLDRISQFLKQEWASPDHPNLNLLETLSSPRMLCKAVSNTARRIPQFSNHQGPSPDFGTSPIRASVADLSLVGRRESSSFRRDASRPRSDASRVEALASGPEGSCHPLAELRATRSDDIDASRSLFERF